MLCIGLICRVENIALLLPSHHDLKQTIRSKTAPLQEGTVRLDALLSKDWIADLSRAGFPSFSGISDLEVLTDLFGKLTLKEAHFVQEMDRRLLTCKLSASDNRWVLPSTLKRSKLVEVLLSGLHVAHQSQSLMKALV